MIVGIVLMSVITWMAWKGKFDAEYYTPVEMSGLYWHVVDIVWIFETMADYASRELIPGPPGLQ